MLKVEEVLINYNLWEMTKEELKASKENEESLSNMYYKYKNLYNEEKSIKKSCDYSNYVSMSKYNGIVEDYNDLFNTCQEVSQKSDLTSTIISVGSKLILCSTFGLCF